MYLKKLKPIAQTELMSSQFFRPKLLESLNSKTSQIVDF